MRKGHSRINQKDIVDVLDKQLLEGMGVLLTEEEQQKCEERVFNFLSLFWFFPFFFFLFLFKVRVGGSNGD